MNIKKRQHFRNIKHYINDQNYLSRCRFSFITGPSNVDAAVAKSLQLCLTLCNPTDGSPPDSAIPGILQARTLEWVAISFSMHESEK